MLINKHGESNFSHTFVNSRDMGGMEKNYGEDFCPCRLQTSVRDVRVVTEEVLSREDQEVNVS